jgi:hypothetical protein
MTPSTKAVAAEIDAAVAALEAQLLSSANVIDELAASLANTTASKAIAARLAREADALRDAADRHRT